MLSKFRRLVHDVFTKPASWLVSRTTDGAGSREWQCSDYCHFLWSVIQQRVNPTVILTNYLQAVGLELE